MDLLSKIHAKAAGLGKTIILPESEEPRILRAAEIILKEGIARIILIGDADKIKGGAEGIGVDIKEASIVNPVTHSSSEQLVEKFYELRKHKGVSREEAHGIKNKAIYFSAMMVHAGEADGYVAGSINATSKVLKPAFQIIKTRPGIFGVSGFCIMVLKDKGLGADGVIFFCDTGVQPEASARGLAQQAVMTAENFEALVGEKAKVAMLSFSTKGSAKHRILERIIEATSLAKEMNPDLIIDGEMQIDAALIKEIGELKAPGSPVAGRANCLIFPDLNSGNIACKITERLAGARAIGPVTQGLNKPANDLSRGCSVEDIVDVVAVTAVQSTLGGKDA